ncbi:MAG: phosphohistidine phosphatase [Gammaproteobacteria bacterium]|jgi:phosphohistidine phosphatase|nr:phosphohistidine phosphatase [Gammaproteobacteria bacterium]
MDLLIIRHAIALDRDRYRWREDAARPLSPAGIRRARKAAEGLKKLTSRPQRLLTSPLVRAKQTAQILTDVAGWPAAEVVSELSPGEPALAVIELLAKDHSKLTAVVGHQPGLGHLLAACMLGGGGSLRIELKKNAVACVSFNGKPRAGQAELKWLATPRMLRALRQQPFVAQRSIVCCRCGG